MAGVVTVNEESDFAVIVPNKLTPVGPVNNTEVDWDKLVPTIVILCAAMVQIVAGKKLEIVGLRPGGGGGTF